MKRNIFNDEQEMFREAVRRFVANEIAPFHESWEHEGIVPREIWTKAGALGFLHLVEAVPLDQPLQALHALDDVGNLPPVVDRLRRRRRGLRQDFVHRVPSFR
jgi:hypothetical protein